MNVNKIGQKAREAFIIQCIKDPKRFEERIPRHKILSFANEGASYSLRGANNKLMAVEMVRDLFGSILFLALQRKIDMAEVLSFPLTPTPLSLSHADGTMLKTQKSKLMEELESRIFSEKPNHVDVIIIDAMFFLHLWKDLPTTFGTIARFLLIKPLLRKEIIYTLYLTKSFHHQSKTPNVIQDQVIRNAAANIKLQDPIKEDQITG